jgi:hypothetical protein
MEVSGGFSPTPLRLMRGPDDGALNEEFLTLAYQAIDD